MARNVDGEFEVLLGNKQLLSVFFIVLILMAVFFTMGYVLGRDSASGGTYARPPGASSAPATQAQSSGFSDTSPGPAATSAAPPADAEAKTGTQPQQQLPTTEPAKPAPPPPPSARAPAGPAPGQVFLQATAGKRADAELVASVLRKKGFRVVLAPGPTEDVFRVLVGPFTDDPTQRKTRMELETAGFKPFTRRY